MLICLILVVYWYSYPTLILAFILWPFAMMIPPDWEAAAALKEMALSFPEAAETTAAELAVAALEEEEEELADVGGGAVRAVVNWRLGLAARRELMEAYVDPPPPEDSAVKINSWRTYICFALSRFFTTSIIMSVRPSVYPSVSPSVKKKPNSQANVRVMSA